MLLEYQAESTAWVDRKLKESKKVTILKIFTFLSEDLLPKQTSDKLLDLHHFVETSKDDVHGEMSNESAYIDDSDDTKTFILGYLEGTYFKIRKDILGLKYDLSLHKEIPLDEKTFMTHRSISVFRKIDELIDEPIIISGDANGAIPLDEFKYLLKSFPNSTELDRYADARISRVLQDYFTTMSDGQRTLATYLSKKSRPKPVSPTQFLEQYELPKYRYLRDELTSNLNNWSSYIEKDWQNLMAEFLLLLFPKYIALLKNLYIKDFYTNAKIPTPRYIDFVLVDAKGSVDIIEIKQPFNERILSHGKYRDNYNPHKELSGSIMQVEKYLFHLNKWGHVGEQDILKKRHHELPPNFKINITNPKGIVILGRDDDFSNDQQWFDFEVIRRKYANIIDILTYDDLLRRLNNIIAMLDRTSPASGSHGAQP